jgi:rod shape-determining protein MreC
LLALIQIGAQRAGSVSPIATVAGSFFGLAESAISAVAGGARALGKSVVSLPQLERDNAQLRDRNRRLTQRNFLLEERAASYAAQSAVRPIAERYRGVEARVIGFPPENESKAVTIDRGSNAGIHREDGVLAAGGVVGRVVAVAPFTSAVMLATDYTSRIPAIVARGRWWGIARGNLGSIVVDYIEQDAPLRVGDVVVTGEGRSFHSGLPIGTVTEIERGNSTLYQTAILKTSVDLGALDRVVVIPQ